MAASWRRAPVVGNGFARLKQDGTALTTIAAAPYDRGQPRFSIVVFSKHNAQVDKLASRLDLASH